MQLENNQVLALDNYQMSSSQDPIERNPEIEKYRTCSLQEHMKRHPKMYNPTDIDNYDRSSSGVHIKRNDIQKYRTCSLQEHIKKHPKMYNPTDIDN